MFSRCGGLQTDNGVEGRKNANFLTIPLKVYLLMEKGASRESWAQVCFVGELTLLSKNPAVQSAFLCLDKTVRF